MRSSITYMWSRIGARMIRIIDRMMPMGMTMFFHESAFKWKRWLSAFFQIDFSYCVSAREWYLGILLDYTTHLMFAGILHILDKRYWGEIYLWSIECDPAEEFSMSVKKKRESYFDVKSSVFYPIFTCIGLQLNCLLTDCRWRIRDQVNFDLAFRNSLCSKIRLNHERYN